MDRLVNFCFFVVFLGNVFNQWVLVLFYFVVVLVGSEAAEADDKIKMKVPEPKEGPKRKEFPKVPEFSEKPKEEKPKVPESKEAVPGTFKQPTMAEMMMTGMMPEVVHEGDMHKVKLTNLVHLEDWGAKIQILKNQKQNSDLG